MDSTREISRDTNNGLCDNSLAAHLDTFTQYLTERRYSAHSLSSASRRATQTVAGQTQVTYGFDNAKRLTNITQGTQSVVISLTWETCMRR